jgi:hypothetical protein
MKSTQGPKSWTEQHIRRSSIIVRLGKGGHFAAWEQPELLSTKCTPHSSRCGNQLTEMAEQASLASCEP